MVLAELKAPLTPRARRCPPSRVLENYSDIITAIFSTPSFSSTALSRVQALAT